MFGHINMITSDDSNPEKNAEPVTKLFNLVSKDGLSEISSNLEQSHIAPRPGRQKDSSIINEESDPGDSFHLLKDNNIFRQKNSGGQDESEIPDGNSRATSNFYHANYLQNLNADKMFNMHFKQALNVQKQNIEKLETFQDENRTMCGSIRERIKQKLEKDQTKLGFLRKDKFLDKSKQNFFKNKNMDFRSVVKNDKIRSQANVRSKHILVICFSRATTRHCSLQHGFFERLNGDKGKRYFNEMECVNLNNDFLKRVQANLKVSESYTYMYSKEGRAIKDIIGFSKENWLLLLTNIPDFKGKNWEMESIIKKDMNFLERLRPELTEYTQSAGGGIEMEYLENLYTKIDLIERKYIHYFCPILQNGIEEEYKNAPAAKPIEKLVQTKYKKQIEHMVEEILKGHSSDIP